MNNGLPYPKSDIIEIAFRHIQHLRTHLILEGLEFSLLSLEVFGSRTTNAHREDGDLDIKVLYTGEAREDDLFNALNSEETRLYIDDIEMDFCPKKCESPAS